MFSEFVEIQTVAVECLVLCELFCACSDRAAVLLIFNGKWLRFLSEPLELAARSTKKKNPRKKEAPLGNAWRLVHVHWPTGEAAARLLRSSVVLCCGNIRRNGSTGSLRDERSFFCLTLSAPTSANNRGTVDVSLTSSLMAAGCQRTFSAS